MKSNQNNKKISLILAAAGLGTRFSPEMPKQYFKIDNQTILEKTLNIFTNISAIKKIVIPLHKNDKEFKKIDLPDGLNIVTVTGGETRAESVLHALKLVDKEDYVIVHDAVRPFIDQKDIHLLIDEFENQNEDCLVYGLPVYESLKNINRETLFVEKSVDRNDFYLAQTPQITKAKSLESSLEICLKENYIPSDESEAIEHSGGTVRFIPGKRKNIKVTVAEDVMNFYKPEEKVGLGFDSHRFKEGEYLILGGVKVPFNKSFDAHSDGDIILHSIVDAMLGSIGDRDIGEHFPNTSEWKDAEGSKLFEITNNLLAKKGFKLIQVDIVVILEEPKLNQYKAKIIKNLSQILKLNEENIGLKAKTSEKMGFIGNNDGAAAQTIIKISK
ncbi:2-C-methyl-D-erythritol 4-phosphate cytidylyltransferase [SAR86 cluster bacterium]|uniref:2-C-methyl-D-erythritol 2,4-cyclodiphosphate synthase n=1 Tax=SAR86 cluster bacterium TaxID=2030880 RepID=A0A9Q8TZQ0_9GAMM|nr:2-C-methyl-D-erythritol 4-phosphate cytidylyltransferase [SAR86 cluster bacterium]